MAPVRLESRIEADARALAASRGYLLVKIQHSHVGLPDRLLLRPDGTAAFVEFKTSRGSVTRIQRYWLNRLRDMGFEAVVSRSLEEFRSLLTMATPSLNIGPVPGAAPGRRRK